MAGSGAISASEEKGGDIVNRRSPEFTMDDLLEEIADQLAVTEEGLTIREICIDRGYPPTKANLGRISKSVSDLIALGRARYVGKKYGINVDGGRRLRPAYALVKETGGEDD